MAFTFNANCLVTSAEAEAFFDVDSTLITAKQKFLIEMTVNAASGLVQQVTGRELKSGSFVEVYDGQESDTIITCEYPITSITSIIFASDGVFASGFILDATMFSRDDNFIRLRNCKTPRGAGVIQATYTAGYSPIPSDLIFATLLQAQYMNKFGGKLSGGQLGYGTIMKMQEQMQNKDKGIAETGLIAEVSGIVKQYSRVDSPMCVSFNRVS